MKTETRRSSTVSVPGRVPPHNTEAEQALLGSMFLSRDAVETGLAAVEERDFYRPAHQRIFAGIRDLHARNAPIDQVSVADRLESVGDLELVGGKAYLLDITAVVPTAANVARYAEIVKRTSTLRDLIEAAVEIVGLGYDAPDDLDEVVERSEGLIFEVTNKRVASEFKPMKDLLKAAFENIEDLAERGEHITGVPTGFGDLDKLLAGLHAGDLVILAARPSVGKTAFALNIATNAARSGSTIAFFSLEMEAEQLIQRILCSEARINLQDVRTGYVKETDWGNIMRAMGALGPLDFHVDDTSAISLLELRAKARRLLRDRPKGLIIVDYLQLMQPPNRRHENRQTEIADISRGLKSLAKDLGVPVIALSQLSRAVEKRENKRPQLSDLRESGAIEQDADVVMFIDRNTDPHSDADDDSRPKRGTAEILVAKHRNGPTGVVPLVFLDRYTKFVSAEGREG